MTNGIHFQNPTLITVLPEHLNEESPSSFFTRNFLSLGLYGVFAIATKQLFLEDLKQNRERVWLSLSLDRDVDEQQGNGFYRLAERVSKVALAVMMWVGNVTTFGVFALYWNHQLSRELQQTVAENHNYIEKERQKKALSTRALDEAVQNARDEAAQKLDETRTNYARQLNTLNDRNQEMARRLDLIEGEKNELGAQLVAARGQLVAALSQQAVMVEEPIDPVCTLPVQETKDLPTFGSLTSALLDNAQPVEYRRRYGQLTTAEAVFKAAFTSIWNALMTMKEKVGVQINDSYETSYSPGANVVYRLMVMELVRDALPTTNCHQEVSLAINAQLAMEPSSPVKATYRDGAGYGSAFFSQRRDAFTPISDRQLADITGDKGVDAVGLKRLLEQFNEQEQEILFYLMLEPVLLDDHLQLRAARAWFKSPSTDPTRIRYVRQAESLINHLVAAFKIRFSDNLQEVWAVCDKDISAFDKSNPETAVACDVVKSWAFSWDAVVGLEDNAQTFGEAICQRQEEYAELFTQLQEGTWKVQNAALNKVWARVKRSEVKSLYYSRHEVISDHGCLFSALLTLIMPDEVTGGNVSLLRKAMANYLNILMQARADKNSIANPELLEQRKKQVELALQLEQAIGATYQVGRSPCTLEQYGDWLLERNSGVTHRMGGDPAGGSEVEILLCAQLLGVRIGVIGIGDTLREDSIGMMEPTRVYGPKTKEILLLAATGINQDSKLGASYYSLFPKIETGNNPWAALQHWRGCEGL